MSASSMDVHRNSGGPQRARMVLDHYDPDPNGRLFRLMVDLAEEAMCEGIDFEHVASLAAVTAAARFAGRNATYDERTPRC